MIVSAAWIGPAMFAVINQIAQARIWSDKLPALSQLLFSAGDWFLYAFLTPFVFALSRRWPLAQPYIARRAAIHLGFSLVFCVAWATAGMLFKAAITLTLKSAAINIVSDNVVHDAMAQYLSWLFETLPFGVGVYLCLVGIEHAIRYFTEAREREVQLARLSEQLATARFSALQAQLNPHFLFNTLNTIAVLVRDGDRAGATGIVEQLSNVLRRTLSRHGANEVPLADELELVRQYLAIEQARFSDRLDPVINISDTLLSAAIPSFALQHLVENAIRHGIAQRTDAKHVTVSGQRDGDMLDLSVSDDGPGVDVQAAIRPGHGLENTRERLRAMFGERASLTVERAAAGGTVATLRIPHREIVLEADDVAR
jgi:two-component system LytT family sensor kinase